MILLSALFMSGLESCRGRGRGRDRDRDRTERRSGRNSDRHRDRSYDDDDNSSYSNEEKILRLAESDDYDAMLSELSKGMKEIKALSKKYFAGKLTDNELAQELEAIQKKYQPIYTRLGEASSNGDLNWKQHQKQIKLFADWIHLYEDVAKEVQRSFR